jgi:hypothetical protein
MESAFLNYVSILEDQYFIAVFYSGQSMSNYNLRLSGDCIECCLDLFLVFGV